jgi:hypothetical protein
MSAKCETEKVKQKSEDLRANRCMRKSQQLCEGQAVERSIAADFPRASILRIFKSQGTQASLPSLFWLT